MLDSESNKHGPRLAITPDTCHDNDADQLVCWNRLRCWDELDQVGKVKLISGH